MKARTSSMLGHLFVGFLAGAFGISAAIQGSAGISNPSVLPLTLLLLLLGLSGLMILVGGIGFIVKKKPLQYIGFVGDIVMTILAFTGKVWVLVVLCAVLAISIYPEFNKNSN
jgi:hypothetical protein